MPIRVLIVDDDELSREVLTLMMEGAGYEVEAVDSGDLALLRLKDRSSPPDVVLTDMHMPGTSGHELVRRLWDVCSRTTLILAMSGSLLGDGAEREFDGFLLKPFSMDALAEAIAGGAPASAGAQDRDADPVLDKATYEKLKGAMQASKLQQLYALCLKDAESRIDRMRRAASDNDDITYIREAHALKGGCGMVGAIELQRLAATMEDQGNSGAREATLDEFMTACVRLRRMLVARESN